MNIGLHLDDPQGWNGYAYGRNNPLKYVDPDGNDYRVCQVDENGKEFNCGVVQSNDKNNTEPFEQYAQSQGWYTQGSTLYDSTETKSALPLGSMVPRKELMQRLPNS